MSSSNLLHNGFKFARPGTSGLGLALLSAGWGAEMSNGRLYTRHLPGKGCIFTLDLPRLDVLTTQKTQIKEVV